MKTWLTTAVAAKMLGVSLQSVSNWIDAGQLRAGRTPGGHRRIERDDLMNFLRQQGLAVPEELQAAPPKVLIVDDEQAVAALLADEIRAQCPDIQVLLAYDGFAAGEIVGAQKPDVVLLDLRMPGMDGFEVCRRIKARPDTRTAAVIAITGHPSPDVERRILACGAQACLAKPPDIALLMQHLTTALAARRR